MLQDMCAEPLKIKAEAVQLHLSLDELLDDAENGDNADNDDDSEAAQHSSSDWTNLMNRGGLLKVTDDAFDVFVSCEEVVRMFYQKSKAMELDKGRKNEIMEEVMKDLQVMEDWAWVSVDMDEEIAKKLLKMLVEEWVKIRGFSFAHAWLELYKQACKKTLQRSKGLRKNLLSNTSDPG